MVMWMGVAVVDEEEEGEEERRACRRGKVGQVSTMRVLKKIARRGYPFRADRMGTKPPMRYVWRRVGISVKGDTSTMPAKLCGYFCAVVGAVMEEGSWADDGSVKYSADAAVTAVPRLWPQRTVRLAGWWSVLRM
jgi:hypothetical protein